MNECIIIIFGATGDLAKRKLIPALYNLIAANKLQKYIIVGAAREAVTAQDILEKVKPFITRIDISLWKKLSESFVYQQTDITKKADVDAVNKLVSELEKKHSLIGNRLVYCAVPASFFCAITQYVSESGLIKKTLQHDVKWQRIVYEKPFGHDLESAQSINACIRESFNEHQIYRIDHYLSKEIVSNIALVRFTNCVFEPLWNNRYIDQVQIILSETVAMEGRGGYYDSYGAVADVLQNHMLELLALIAMETPERLTGEYIRSERAYVLSKVRVVDGLLGQYEGYTKEAHVGVDSKTETFAVAQMHIDNPRWAGVPFYFKTGKALDKKETVIHIKFKQVDCLLVRYCPSESNYLTIEVSPEAVLALNLNVKKPHALDEVMPVRMEFAHSSLFGGITPEAYEALLEDIMRGEQSISVRFDEIESAWNIVRQFKNLKLALYEYRRGSRGPDEMAIYEKNHGMKWRS